MRRRDFIAGLGALAMPHTAYTQEKVRRIGALAGVAEEPATRARYVAFEQAMQQLGWTQGRNVRIDYRWGAGSADTLGKQARELAAAAPDVILVTGGASQAAMLQATKTVPIVFVIVPDPVGSGFVDSLSRPGRNATGFMQFEYSLSGKWLELLKQIAPQLKVGDCCSCSALGNAEQRTRPLRPDGSWENSARPQWGTVPSQKT